MVWKKRTDALTRSITRPEHGRFLPVGLYEVEIVS